MTSSGIPALKQKEAAAVCLRHQQRQLVPLFVRSTFTSRQSAPSVCGELARSAATLHTTRVLKSDRTGLTAALRYRFTGPVRPVTGGNRLNSNSNSNKFKNSHTTGSDRFTGRFDRFTGRFYRFEIQKLPCNWFTGRFDRFTDRFDRWAFMGRPIFFLFLF